MSYIQGNMTILVRRIDNICHQFLLVIYGKVKYPYLVTNGAYYSYMLYTLTRRF